jgi:hypothetical protein
LYKPNSNFDTVTHTEGNRHSYGYSDLYTENYAVADGDVYRDSDTENYAVSDSDVYRYRHNSTHTYPLADSDY